MINTVILLTGLLSMGSLTRSVHFQEDEVSFETINGYQTPRIKNCGFIPRPGEPQLPVRAVYFLLPQGTAVKAVTAKGWTSEPLPGHYNVCPSQPPQILSTGAPGGKTESLHIPFVQPERRIYGSNREYPGKLVEFVGQGFMRGHRIAEVLVYPLQWNPGTRKLELYTTVEIKLELSSDPRRLITYRGNTPFRIQRLITSLVVNPENFSPIEFLRFSPSSYEYLIITSSGLATAFQPLADWQTSKGIPAVIRTTDWIEATYTGRDLAEKIRDFIKVAVSDSGAAWVLLGGDVDVVPARVAYAMTCMGGHSGEDSIRADLYYSDLDGSWDANGNDIFGEVQDSVDLYPDIFVGRAPTNSTSDVQTFVNKVIAYEANPADDYVDSVLFAAEVLWSDPYTDAGIGKNMIGELFPDNFGILKLYESLGNENVESVVKAMNDGKGMINHDGHAWWTAMGVGTGYVGIPDVDSLTNGNEQGILYSIGCWPAAFDFDCIAEHWVLNPNGGGVAFIGNSRYGWGSPGNPGYGYSDKMDESFYYNLFKENISHIGATLAKSKVDYIAFSRGENVWRWHQYQVNLLGDPEMDIWTRSPAELQVSYPESVSVGESVLKVTVSTEGNARDILVCCKKGDEVYERGHTDEAGEISFNIQPTSTGSLQVCATYHDCLPQRGAVTVYATGPYPGYHSHSFTDSNHNGEVNPEEPIDLAVTLKNYGTQPASNVTANLSSSDPCITIVDGSGSFGNMTPGSTSQSDFSFRVGSCSNGHIIECKLEIAGFSSVGLNFEVRTPSLEYDYYAVSSTPEPGDTFDLWIAIANTGGLAPGTILKIGSQDPNLLLVDTLAQLGTLGSGSVVSRPFRVGITSGCPARYFAPIGLELSSTGFSFADTFLLAIGSVVLTFFDDFESGAPGWSHGGITDLWSVTDHNPYSGTHSWYCGNTGPWQYQNNMNCWLLSPEFILGPDARLSFRTWFNVATYGVDGVRPIIKQGILDKDTLDFIGSGGALLNFVVDWTEYSYDLSSHPVGSTFQVKLGFVSDTVDVAEGFYIDDVRVGERETPVNLHKALVVVKDSLGNGDEIVDPGESVFVYIWLINEGTSTLLDADGVVYTVDPYVTLLPSGDLDFGSIQGRHVADGWFSFTTLASAPIGHEITFVLQVDEFSFDIKMKVGVDVEEDREVIKPYLLCLPNPFAGSTNISYSVPSTSENTPVSITIYDAAGRTVKSLVDRPMKPGHYQVPWDGRRHRNGVYFVRLELPTYKRTAKLILLK